MDTKEEAVLHSPEEIEQIRQENRELEAKIAEVQMRLRNNGNELKFLLGDTVWKCRMPRIKLLTLCYKLPKVYIGFKRTHRVDRPVPVCEDPFVYHERLVEEKRRLRRFMRMDEKTHQYAIGSVIVNAWRSPKSIVMLPLDLTRMWRKLEQERKLMRASAAGAAAKGGPGKKNVRKPLGRIEGIKPVILFVATNGVGLGHLTRCLAIGKRIQEKCQDMDVLFLTTSPALTIIKRAGFVAYNIPSKEMLPEIKPYQWNCLLRDMLLNLFDLYDCRGIVYDGAIPYTPIVSVMAQQHDIAKVWVKRGRGKVEGGAREEAEQHFDYIVVPGEAGVPLPADDEHHHYVSPVLNLNRDELWSREEVRTFLKIPEDKLAVYVQLGAGNINDINSDIYKIVTALRKLGNVVMILGESLIGAELKLVEDDIIVIKDYPNSKYLNGFDFAVSACGYNSFHEMIYFGVPTLFIPNMNTKTDDQYGRAMAAQEAGAAFVAADLDQTDLEGIFRKMADPTINRGMKESAYRIMDSNGAEEAADFIIDYVRKRHEE